MEHLLLMFVCLNFTISSNFSLIISLFSTYANHLYFLSGLLTGCGKKIKIVRDFGANCAGKNTDCAGIVRDCTIFRPTKNSVVSKSSLRNTLPSSASIVLSSDIS